MVIPEIWRLARAAPSGILPGEDRGPITLTGNAWPMRPFSFEGDKRVFRCCYICHITGMELGCLMYETQSADCGRERGGGSRIEAL